MTFLSRDNGTFGKSCEIGYPQGKNLSPATMSASMRNATKSLPWIQAFAPSRSVFLKWPSSMSDFNRLKAISICQRPRYASSTIVGVHRRSRVVKTKVYPAASIVSGLTSAPFRLFSWSALRRAFSAASLLFFNAQTLPAMSVSPYGTHASQSPSFVLVNVLKWRDLEGFRLDVDLEPGEIVARQENLPASPVRVTSGYLARYAALVGSADEGAVLKRPVAVN